MTPSRGVDFSLVLACYNEAPHLARSVERVLSVLDAMRRRYEVILVDDLSRDGTRQVIARLLAEDGRGVLKALLHERNTGRGGAVRDGFLAAAGTVVGFLDVDLEVAAHYLLPCIQAIDAGADAVIGKRIYTFQWRSLDRYVLSKGYAWLVRRVLNLPGVTDTESGCKLFRRDALLPVLARCEDSGWFWDTEVIARSVAAGLSVAEVPCLFLRQLDKPSSVRPVRDSLAYLRKLLRFSRSWRRREHAAAQMVCHESAH